MKEKQIEIFAMKKEYPDVSELFEMKKEWRKRMKKRPVAEKLEVANRLKELLKEIPELTRSKRSSKAGTPAGRRAKS